MYVIKRTGEREEVSFDKCIKRIQKLSKDLKINPMEIAQLIITQIYNGVETYKLDELAAEICAAKTTMHPDYGKLASRIIISNHHKNTSPSYSEVIQQLWNNTDILGIHTPLINELLYKMVLNNKEKINATIDYEKDFNYDYFGFKTLEKSYLMKVKGKLIERPQHMLMRVSLSIHKDDLKEALKSYKLMSDGYFTHATPTLFNMGSCREQASSCFLLTVDDDSIDGIYKTLGDCAKISKYAGGIGIAFHKIRAKHSYIRGNNGKSNGLVPMLKVFNETARYVDQGSRRAGSIACFCADTEVLTINEGVKKIQDINIGDLVITHKNRVRPVIQCHKNVLGDRKIYKLEVEKNKDIYVTGNHEFWSFHTNKYKNKNNKKNLGWNSITTLKNIIDKKLTSRTACYISIPSSTNIKDTKDYKIDVMDYEHIILNNTVKQLKETDNKQIIAISKCISTNTSTSININKVDNSTRNIYSHPVNRIWNITEDFANLIGIWLGAGNINIKKTHTGDYVIGIQFRINKNNKEEINYITKVCNEVFNCKVKCNDSKTRNITYIVINSHIIGTIFMELFGSSFNSKKLHNMIFKWHINLVNNLIAGLFTTNGHITKNKCNATLRLSNEHLMNQLYHLCRNNGIDVSFVKGKIYNNNMAQISYSMSIPLNKNILSKTYKLYTDDRIKRCYEKVEKQSGNPVDTFLKILNITETDRNDEYVYTLGVDEDHSYTVEGLLVKNCYLEPWHADIEDFLKLRLNTGIEEERARDLFYSMWTPDLFMRRVEDDANWTLMCPDKCPNLYLKYGKEFEDLYMLYEKEGRGHKVVKARAIWEQFLQAQIETGLPYLGFKDAINEKNNQKNLGTIQSSNLCHEICEYTSKDEIAVCNLASIALPKYLEENKEWGGSKDSSKDSIKDSIKDNKLVFNFELLRDVVKQIVKNLNKVIDYNFYPVKEAEYSNRRHRPIGIGVSGLADTFALLKYSFESPEAQKLNRLIFENIYYASLEASMEIARKRKKSVQEYKRLCKLGSNNNNGELTEEDKQRMNELKKQYFIIDDELKLPNQFAGSYSSYCGSPISEGKMQFDLWGVNISDSMRELWATLKTDISKHGVRNSLLVALMPTASTSQILGWNECFEPFTNNIYTRKTIAGTFVIVNKYLINDLLELGIWNATLKDKIILANGSVQDINEIPIDIRLRYKTVWELKQKTLIDLAADRAPFICQTQSMNLFIKNPTFKTLSAMHFYSWKKGLKTGIYYLRSQSKTSAQKFSVDLGSSATNTNTNTSITSNTSNTSNTNTNTNSSDNNIDNISNTTSNSSNNTITNSNNSSNTSSITSNNSSNTTSITSNNTVNTVIEEHNECLMCSS